MNLHDQIQDAERDRGAACPDSCGGPYYLVHDLQAMPDGRLLHHWAYEIDSLREKVRELESSDREAQLRTERPSPVG